MAGSQRQCGEREDVEAGMSSSVQRSIVVEAMFFTHLRDGTTITEGFVGDTSRLP